MFARYRTFLAEAKAEWKLNGTRSVFRRHGWKILAIVFTTYLVRDIALYVALPWLVARTVVAD